MHAFGFQVAVSPQEYLEIVIKRPVKASQRHIFHAFLFPDKSGKMLVGTLIGVVCFLYAVYPDPFPELLVMLPEKSQQGKRFLSDTLDCVFDQFSRDEPQAVSYPLIMSGNLTCQVIYGTVHGNGILAPSVGTAFLRIPDTRIDRDFGSYLCPFGINAHLAQ